MIYIGAVLSIHQLPCRVLTGFLLFMMAVLFASSGTAVEKKEALPCKDIYSCSPDYSHALKESKEKIVAGKYDEALSLLSPYTADPLKYPDAVSDYLVILVWIGRHDEAINLYEELPPSFPSRSYLLRNIAKAFYEKAEFQKAFRLYSASLLKTPEDEETRKGVVFSLIKAGDTDRAMGYLKRFLLKTPGSIDLNVAWADILLMKEKYAEALDVFRSLENMDGVDAEGIYKVRDDLVSSLAPEKRRTMVDELQKAVRTGEVSYDDYILVRILNRDFKTAVKAFEGPGLAAERFSPHMLSWIAWAYFKTEDINKAKYYYGKALEVKPDYFRAKTGLAYCYAKEGKSNKALDILDGLLTSNPQNIEVMFARAYVFERMKRYWDAIKEYEHIVEISKKNMAAFRSSFMALSDLGVSSFALDKSREGLPHDAGLHERIIGDMGTDRIRWKEYKDAMDIIRPYAEKKKLRSRYDYIAALAGNEDMEEAVKVYEELINEGIVPPGWVKENAAGAYLYIERPREALALYNDVLKTDPKSFNSRIGKFYVLQELREWEEAGKVLEDLDRDTPEVLKAGRNRIPNWPEIDITLAKGWLMLYEDRLEEGEGYFRDFHERAPANTGIRTGLAHAYLWRGWPRKALREFRILDTLEPKNVSAQIGKIWAMNTLAVKERAREESDALLALKPKHKHVQDLVRMLELEEMRELIVDFVISADDDGFDEIMSKTALYQPMTLYTRAYGFVLWQKSSDTEQDSFFRRAGLGVEHIFNSSWRLRQQFAANYNDGEDFGSLTEIEFTPDDYRTFSLSYDSFTTDIPMRARVFDVEADKISAGVTYRESDRRSYSAEYSYFEFSDDNRRNQGLLGYEQGLYVKNNWKMRLFFDFFTSANSLDDARYFNPDNDFSISATHMTEQIVTRIYRKAFVHRLYLSTGLYKQAGFSTGATGSVRYEHDVDFSDTHSLLYGVSLGRQVYDGEAVTGRNIYLRWRLLF